MEITGSGNEMFQEQGLGITKRIAGETFFETQHSANITSANFSNIFAMISMHFRIKRPMRSFLPLVCFELFVPGSKHLNTHVHTQDDLHKDQ
jgi:hypothetical protein